ncbi:Gfo/Idh/MocA family oxidoreductase [Thiohalocapsa marina]|uniref:Gfo/Idh/MocA family oxidoreductase n=1 Tax=Thiohalocapsa marina TaxID=424902 RepID=A0A5M8FHM8_9GAMM|nr:Gfo/Idh/MocA family oxidoreductase [Thiohalocapsa marina]KAA6183924.1 Gfo/Idh/MocA family oxidoreductase [Thiohalocapsa marina]
MNSRSVRRVALVGLGSIGRRHLRLLKQLRPDIDVILVRSGHGGRWPEEALAAESVTSIDEAMAMGIDAAIIASPAPYHVPQALELLRTGIPLLIEKPLSHNLEGVAELAELAEQRQVPVLVGYVLRHSPDLRWFHQQLREERVGRLVGVTIDCGSYLPDWRPEQDYRKTASARAELGGGVLLELSHELDYAHWLFGPFDSIDASLTNSGTLGIAVEDTADLMLTTRAGLTVTIHLDFLRREAIRQCIAHGADGDLVWDGVKKTVRLQHVCEESVQWPFELERDAMFRTQLMHFLACIEQDDAPKVTLADGIAALTLVEAARQSQRQGRVINL